MFKRSSSLASFVQSAMLFLKNEIHANVTEELVTYILVYHFDSFSAAYMKYREEQNDSTKAQILKVIELARERQTSTEEPMEKT
jgi:hypothetical protein